MYDFPVHDYTQEHNGSPFFPSIVGQCKWLSLSRKTVEIQTCCYHSNHTSLYNSARIQNFSLLIRTSTRSLSVISIDCAVF